MHVNATEKDANIIFEWEKRFWSKHSKTVKGKINRLKFMYNYRTKEECFPFRNPILANQYIR